MVKKPKLNKIPGKKTKRGQTKLSARVTQSPWGPLYRNKNQNETKYMVKKTKLNKIPGKKKKEDRPSSPHESLGSSLPEQKQKRNKIHGKKNKINQNTG